MYKYEDMISQLADKHGSVMYAQIRRNVKSCLARSGAVTMGKAISGTTGNTLLMLACVDHMVKGGELREVTKRQNVEAQHRVFVQQ